MKVRWRLIIQPRFQTWFMTRFMIYLGALTVFLSVGIYLWWRIVDQTMFRLVGLISPSILDLLKLNSERATKVFIALACTLVALTVVASFIFSRRIAGPLFAFVRHLKKCEENGQLEEFNLRKGDLFGELTENFNQMVQAINSKKVPRVAKESEIPQLLQSFGSKNLRDAEQVKADRSNRRGGRQQS